MNSSDYTSLLNQPEAVNERQTEALEKIVAEFPYFQSARALRLKGLYNQNSFQYNYALKVTAAYTTDRSVLFDFITSDTFTTIQKGQYEEKVAEINNIPVQSEVVDDQPKEEKIDYANTAELAKQSILTSIKEAGLSDADGKQAVDEEKPVAESIAEQNTVETATDNAAEEINAEEFGPVGDEPQFLPEAIAPIEFVPVAMPEAGQEETEEAETTVEPGENQPEETAQPESAGKTTSEKETLPDAAETTSETVAEIQAVEEKRNETEPAGVQDTAELIEKKLEIGKPLEFSKTETHSFSEWLQLSKMKPIVRINPDDGQQTNQTPVENPVPDKQPQQNATNESQPKVSKTDLIDRFIETNPKIPKITQDVQPAVVAQLKEDHSSLMTETLARVYLEQKKYQKAIQAYEILILKYPEKSTFFADRISEIKNLQQNNIL